MRKVAQHFPPGWDERKVRAIIDHYDKQTDQEGATEIETAAEPTGKIWMAVPMEMVPEVARLIEAHQRKAPTSRRRRASRTKTR